MAGTDTRGTPADATGYGRRPAFSGRGSGAGGAGGSPGGGLFAGFPSNNDGLFAGFDPNRNIRNAQQAQEEEKKKNLAQKLIAKLREEGIPEELIQRELANYPTAQALLGALQNIMSIISRLREAGGFGAAIQESKDYIIDAAGNVVNAAGDIISDPKGEIKRRLLERREQVGQNIDSSLERVSGGLEDLEKYAPRVSGVLNKGVDYLKDNPFGIFRKREKKADGGIMSLQDGGATGSDYDFTVYGDPSTLSSPVGGFGIGQLLGIGQAGNRGLEQSTDQGFDQDVDQDDADKLGEILKKAQAALLAAGASPEEVAKIGQAEYAMRSAEGLLDVITNPQSYIDNFRNRVDSAIGAVKDAGRGVAGVLTGEIPVGQALEETGRTLADQTFGNQLRNTAGILGRGGRFLGGLRRKMGIKGGIGIPEMLGGASEFVQGAADSIRPNQEEEAQKQANGGIMSLKDGGESDLRNIAKQRSAEVYGDPVIFERFAPSPLQVQNPAFRGSQFFMPPGEVPNFNMGIMGLPGQMYGNYYPAGSVGQMNPLNKRVMGMPGGAQMPPPPGSEPTTPPPSEDTGMTGEVWDKKYEDVVPKPKRADFAEGPFQGKKGSEAFQRALDEWNKNQKIWDSFETGAERKEYYIGGLDFSNLGFAAGGSTNFPRKNGQISGPGTERSDDIPAMLSDGEFVVNAKAVRGIGSLMGMEKPKTKAEQRRQGARTMYALQNAGEKASGLRG
tara:strand:+ start:137 stop:2326 length:2190 start_codon:yes stop_codon:yes gene_type:complete